MIVFVSAFRMLSLIEQLPGHPSMFECNSADIVLENFRWCLLTKGLGCADLRARTHISAYEFTNNNRHIIQTIRTVY